MNAAHIFRGFALAALLAATGCGSLPRCASSSPTTNSVAEPKSAHVIEIDGDGFLIDLRDHEHRTIRREEDAAAYLEETVFAGFRNSGKSKILLFVHGGMNDRATGMSHYTDFEKAYNKDTGDYYAVFVVWPSGLLQTYAEHLLWVRQGIKAETPEGRAFGLVTSPFVLLADIGRAITRLPLVVASNSRSDIVTAIPIRKLEKGAIARQYQDLSQEYFLAIGNDYSRDSDRVLRDVTYWATIPLKYFAAAMIDGLGKGGWDDMLRRAQEVYPARLDTNVLENLNTALVTETNTVQGLAAPDTAGPAKKGQRYVSRRQEKRIKHYQAAGLPLFMKGLRERQQADGKLEVTLVGHSMGTIILNRVIRDARMEFTNVVYLGAACSISDFERSVLPYMQLHTNTQFYNVSLHPVAEAGEINAADLTPRGSLLVWVDNFLANPATERERTLGSWRNLFFSSATGEPIVQSFFRNQDGAELANRLHFRACSVGFGGPKQMRRAEYQWNKDPKPETRDERCNTPLKHGEFSDMPWWEADFWWRAE